MTNRSERAFDFIECAVMFIYIVIKHQHLPHRRSWWWHCLVSCFLVLNAKEQGGQWQPAGPGGLVLCDLWTRRKRGHLGHHSQGISMFLDAIVIQICYAQKAYACQCKQVEENGVLSLRNIQLASSVVGWNNAHLAVWSPSCFLWSACWRIWKSHLNLKNKKIYNKHRTGQGNCTKAILQDTHFIEHVNIRSNFKRQNRWTHWPELRKKLVVSKFR